MEHQIGNLCKSFVRQRRENNNLVNTSDKLGSKEAFKSRIAEGWQHKQREDESNIVTNTLKELNKGENWVDPDGEQSAAEYHAKNIAAGVGSAAVAGVTGLADAIQGTVLNAAAFTSRALGAEDAADTIADVRKDASENIRAMREKF